MSRLLTILLFCAAVRPMTAAGKPFAFGTVRFEANRGQADSAVRYLARARGQQVFFTDTGVVFSPPAGPAIRMTFAGSGRPVWITAAPPSDSISYFTGRNPEKWVKGAPVYDRIVWRGVYPGVDVEFYGDGDRLEYDLVLAPGANPNRVRIQFASPAHVSGNSRGVLEISAGGTRIRQRVPAIYQESASGVRRKIAGDFRSTGPNAATLKVASYDRSERLVVDPVIEMATYIGGENDDELVAIADGVVGGNTRSIAFPPTSPSMRAGRDVFIRGTGQLVPGQVTRTAFYGTVVIGGSGDDELAGIALNNLQGIVYIAGTTTSTDFPASGSSKYKGGASDGFVAYVAISQSYASLNYSFYVGGSGEDRITAFTGSDSLQALVGVTDSQDLPVGDVPQKALSGGKDGFYYIFSGLFGGSTYGYIGGSGDDAAYAVSIRSNGWVWIGGETRSSDFPFPDAGLAGPSDGFLAEVSAPGFLSGTPTVKVTAYRIGGNGEDSIRALAAAPSSMTASLGSAQVTRPFTPADIGFAGTTTSTDLPVRNAAQPQFAGERDGFAGMWNVAAAAPRWLTYLGGTGPDEATAVAEDWAGDLYVAGWTRSTDLPVSQALQPASAGGEDGMFAVFDANGAVQHLTYFGGSGDDRIRDVRLIYGSVARVAGSTTSTDLPQRTPAQGRGGQTDGFWADIGTDYLIGPSELILAKDGALSFSVRPGRTAYRNPVTYRSSDPSRVRLVYRGHSLDEVTAALEDDIAIEALTDSGEATITVTAPGFATRNILVKLYPGAFLPSYASVSSLSTWGSPIFIYAAYRAVDPATGQAVGSSAMSIRAGVAPPILNWSVSDPSIFEIVNTNGSRQLRALKAGEATVSLTVEGFTVIQGDRTIAAITPRPLSSSLAFRLGRDLFTNLPLTFGLGESTVISGYRGTLTARSADPGRLLLSLAADQPGLESVTVTMSGSQPTIWAQALAGDGTVQVILTSSEFDGEIPMTVTLEPATIAWGVSRYVQGTGTVIDPAVSLTVGTQTTQLVFSLQGQSGSFASGYRPGAPPVTVKMSNSDPKTVELNRLTRTLGSNDSGYTLRGMNAGTSELTLTTSSEDLRPANESVHVEVTAAASVLLIGLPSTVYVGKGLQASVTFRYSPALQTVEILSDDADAALVSSSVLVRGSAHLSLSRTSSDDYAFQVQALKSDGETRLHLRFPTGEEREVRVVLMPAGAGFSGNAATSGTQGFDRSIRVVAWALDRQTGVGVFNQIPQPGPGIAVRFRSEGADVSISPGTATLTASASETLLNYTLPPAGQEATLITESDAEGAVSPVTGRMRVVRATPVPARDTLLLARNDVRQYVFSSSVTASPVTVTSSDPDRVQLSATATAAGSPSIDIGKYTTTIYIHALGDSGNATVRFESSGVSVLEVQVALQPLVLNYSYSNVVTVGGSTECKLSLNAYTLRPNSGPYRFSVQSANPSVATVDPATFELGGEKGIVSATLRVHGVAPGTTQIILDGPPEIVALPIPVTVGGAPQEVIPAYTVGKNLQGSAQLDLGSSFTNPNGAIVTLTSSEPGRLLLSRAASTSGTASVNVAVPAGDHRTQLIYFQALEEGDAVIQLTANDATRTVATFHIARSWMSCGPQPGAVVVGSAATKDCGVRYTSTTAYILGSVSARAGLGDVNLLLESSAPDVFTVTPQRLSLQTGSGQVTLRGISPGAGELRLTSPAGFGPSPDGSEVLAVSVTQPRLATNCPAENAFGKDTQITCTFTVPSGVTVTAVSQDSSRIVVSSDAKVAGEATATATVATGGTGVAFTLQGLAASGTTEVVFSARGYQDLRLALALRPTGFYWSSLPYTGQVSLHVGGSAALTLALGMASNGYPATPRAGASIAVDVLMDPSGIVSLEPARVVFNGPASRGDVQVKATAAGSTLLRIAVPDGFSVYAAPLPVNVLP